MDFNQFWPIAKSIMEMVKSMLNRSIGYTFKEAERTRIRERQAEGIIAARKKVYNLDVKL